MKIEKVNYSGLVHNLEVEDNNNYFADDILVSNCHQTKAYNINKIGKQCVNADYRLGFTGTLSDDVSDNYNIKSVLADVIFDLKSGDLIDKGILSKIKIINLLLNYPQYICNEHKKDYYQEESNFISSYSKRNDIFKYIFKFVKDGENSLILVSKIDHLKSIEEYIVNNFSDKYKVAIIYGKTKTKQRDVIRQSMEKEKNMIIIATYQVASVGINIKRLHNVILASSMKSEIKIPQAIGRGLRKHDDKKSVKIWDIIDNLKYKKRKNYVLKHWDERKKLYKKHGFKYFTKKINLDSI